MTVTGEEVKEIAETVSSSEEDPPLPSLAAALPGSPTASASTPPPGSPATPTTPAPPYVPATSTMTVTAVWKNYNIRQAVNFFVKAWGNTTKATVRHAWSALLPQLKSVETKRQQPAELMNQVLETVRSIPAPGFQEVTREDLEELMQDGHTNDVEDLLEDEEGGESDDAASDAGETEQRKVTTQKLSLLLGVCTSLQEMIQDIESDSDEREQMNGFVKSISIKYQKQYNERVNARQQSLITRFLSQRRPAEEDQQREVEVDEDIDDIGEMPEDFDFAGFEEVLTEVSEPEPKMEDLEKLIKFNENNKNVEEEEVDSRPQLSLMTLAKIIKMGKVLGDRVFEKDPFIKRGIKFKMDLNAAITPYKATYKALLLKTKQVSKIRLFKGACSISTPSSIASSPSQFCLYSFSSVPGLSSGRPPRSSNAVQLQHHSHLGIIIFFQECNILYGEVLVYYNWPPATDGKLLVTQIDDENQCSVSEYDHDSEEGEKFGTNKDTTILHHIQGFHQSLQPLWNFQQVQGEWGNGSVQRKNGDESLPSHVTATHAPESAYLNPHHYPSLLPPTTASHHYYHHQTVLMEEQEGMHHDKDLGDMLFLEEMAHHQAFLILDDVPVFCSPFDDRVRMHCRWADCHQQE
ncbi:hypothetical protein Hamer_G004901 [Homarus americanus]|uniref:Uncharacterized protein n=1 Tax=Homarus americanus TaxID=6706 RepID=A0A8J5JWG7_HOMAM|nr:hypothetical protein Hamer_G004901 [Homarus americanus]